MTIVGLRERKKARTERDIVRAATRAFIERGYERVTLDEIAEAAEVHKRTLLRYFPSKAHLLLSRHYAALEEFRDQIARRGDVPAIDIWEKQVRHHADISSKQKYHRELAEIIDSDPNVCAEALRIDRDYQEILASALERDLRSVESPQLVSKVVAAALVSGNAAVYRSLIQNGLYTEHPEKLLEVITLIRGLLPA
jgi:AcrR family transcriptional regulator